MFMTVISSSRWWLPDGIYLLEIVYGNKDGAQDSGEKQIQFLKTAMIISPAIITIFAARDMKALKRCPT